MARVLLLLLGLGLAALGGWLCVIWWEAVEAFLQALVAIGLGMIGLLFVIFGLSEIASGRKKPSSEGE